MSASALRLVGIVSPLASVGIVYLLRDIVDVSQSILAWIGCDPGQLVGRGRY